MKCHNCKEEGSYQELEQHNNKWYCEICFFMQRMDKDGVINAIDKMEDKNG